MKPRTVIPVVIVATACAVMVLRATKGTASVVRLPSELASAGSAVERVRVRGVVSDDRISYETEPKLRLRFWVKDPPAGGTSPGRGEIAVVYEGAKPDMFRGGREVLVDGRFDGSALAATELLTQCPSKYEPPSPSGGGGGPGAGGRESGGSGRGV